MDHRGLRARLTGAGCTSCGAGIPVERIVVLADRGDFAFVELDCQACGSRTMGLVLAAPAGEEPVLDTAGHPELDPDAAARLASRPPVDEDDLIAMHRLLDGWTGDLRTLVGADRATDDGATDDRATDDPARDDRPRDDRPRDDRPRDDRPRDGRAPGGTSEESGA